MAKTQFFRKPGKRGYRDMRTKKKPASCRYSIDSTLLGFDFHSQNVNSGKLSNLK